MTRPLLMLSTFLLFVFFVHCTKDRNVDILKDYDTLRLLEVHNLSIEDPSGLSRSAYEGMLYTVSDDSGNIYLINLQGQIMETLHIGGHDLEGIEYVESENMLYVVEEQMRRAKKVSPEGEVLQAWELDIPVQNINDGPEGIAFNPETQHFYIVNEKNPPVLYVYNTDFVLQEQFRLDFARDYSSVDYEQGHLWILSHESKILARCNFEGKPDIIYYTDVPKGEGVVVDVANNRVYIVCDSTERLYIYAFPH